MFLNCFSQTTDQLISSACGGALELRRRMMNQDAEASSSTTSHYSSSSSILSNYSLLAALLSFVLAQTIKVFTSWSLGVVSGMTGGGGNVGAVLTQLIFFKGSRYSKETGITLIGIMIICCTFPICLIYFPQWGGMFCGPSSKENATEEDYYSSGWNSKEKEKGFHHGSLKFADNSRGERGGRVGTAATPSHGTSFVQV